MRAAQSQNNSSLLPKSNSAPVNCVFALSRSFRGRCTAISAPMDGAPGIESVAPCVCSDCTRCVLAFTAATASVGLGSAEKAIGGGSPVLRRSHACDRQPAEENKNQEPKHQ